MIETMTTNSWAVFSFLGYILLLIVIGLYSMRFSSHGMSEFFLGGRSMNKFVVALSAVVSGRSSWLLIGATGMAYTRGASAIWAIVGYVCVEFFMFVVIAPRLRTKTAQQNDLTLPDFFESAFADKSHVIRLISVTIILIFMISYISAQFVGGGKAFAASFQLDQTSGILVTAIIVLIYTMMGGFMAVSLTDVAQAFFMIFALVILPVIVIFDLNGLESMKTILFQLSPHYVDPFSLSAGALFGFLGIGLGSFGNPHILVRYMSIKNPDGLRFSAFIGTFWNVIMGWSAIFIGLAGRALVPNQAILPGGDAENIFVYLAHQYLHPALFGVIIAAILAAIMSTADSMLLVSASAIIRDIYQKIMKPKAHIEDKTLVFYSRIIVLVLVAISFAIGMVAKSLVFWLVLFAWGGMGAAFGPALLFTLFYPKTTRAGIVAGMLTGTVTVIVWNQITVLKSIIYELIPAFIFSSLIIYIISLWQHNKEHFRRH